MLEQWKSRWSKRQIQPRRPRPRTILRLEGLEERWCPATVDMYWDPTSGNNASTIVGGQAVNWDQGSLGSGVHPSAAPGMTADETDNVYLDGTAGQGGNKSCTWDYTPTNSLGALGFKNGWTQTVTFLDKQGLAVSSYSYVTGSSAPTLTPNGSSGANAVPAIALTNGALFNVDSGTTLFLTGDTSGNAIFFAGDGKAGEYLANGGTVSYKGSGSQVVDYLKIPVLNSWIGAFKVNGNAGQIPGSELQVSGADATNTKGVSFYQNSSAETDISGGGTLWCYNDYWMDSGLLQTTDGNLDFLEVGTKGSSPVDGTVTLLGGAVNINAGTNAYGKLDIWGTTTANNPIVNVGSATLNFKVNMNAGSLQSDQLIVGRSPGTGKINFGYNSGTSVVGITPEGNTTTGHQWQVILFGSVTGTASVTLNPATGYTTKWNSNNLEIDN